MACIRIKAKLKNKISIQAGIMCQLKEPAELYCNGVALYANGQPLVSIPIS